MFERFSEETRVVLSHAREEARALGQASILPEHLLLALLGDDLVRSVLGALGTRHATVRSTVLARVTAGPTTPLASTISYSPSVQQVFESTLEEVVGFGHRDIGTGHLLIALAREEESLASEVLATFGGTVDLLRKEVLESFAQIDEGRQPAA